MTVLHLGCGRKRLEAADLFEYVGLKMDAPGAHVLHLDADPTLSPDLLCRLGDDAIPLPDNSVDLAIAWHVIEHIGTQGQTAEWFAFWEDLYRVLKPGGWLYGECPYYTSIWAWSDPTHTRALSEAAFVFFDQDAYRIPQSAISPYRIACDFGRMAMPGLPDGYQVVTQPENPKVQSLRFALTAKKPLSPWWEN